MNPPLYDDGAFRRPNAGERWVFEQLKEDPRDWVVLHSLDIARHPSQRQGEIDFLVMAPGLGVLVLEVKGWVEARFEDGRWYHDDKPQGDRRGPFRQATEGKFHLIERLQEHLPHLERVLVESAACFPFLTLAPEGEQCHPEEWHSWQAIDQARLRRESSLAACIETVFERSHAWARERGQRFERPTLKQCRDIVDLERPDFEVLQTEKERTERGDEEARRYTTEELRALDAMEANSRVVFDGPAGTGKTLLALEAARRSRVRGKSVLVLCFDRAQAIWLEDQGKDLTDQGKMPLVAYRSINFHMDAVAGLADKPPYSDRGFWDNGLPEAAAYRLVENLEIVQATGRSDPALGIFDELIVDEAQDVLCGRYKDVLDYSVLGGLDRGTWRMFGDFAGQKIYGDGIPLDEMRTSYDCTVYRLGCNCRNTPKIATLAGNLAARTPAYREVRRADDGRKPVVRAWRTRDEQIALLEEELERLWQDDFKERDVVVLTTRPQIAQATAAEVRREPWSERLEPLDDPNILTPHPGKVRYSTVRRFRGLEAPVVVLTDVEALDNDGRTLLYVGVTRATQRLVVLAHISVATGVRAMCRDRRTLESRE
jgi:hypothetical protein